MVASAPRSGIPGRLLSVSVDFSPFAVIRSLADHDHLGLDNYAEAIVDIGAKVTNIAAHLCADTAVRPGILPMGGGDHGGRCRAPGVPVSRPR